jgi:hypothetical protein
LTLMFSPQMFAQMLWLYYSLLTGNHTWTYTDLQLQNTSPISNKNGTFKYSKGISGNKCHLSFPIKCLITSRQPSKSSDLTTGWHRWGLHSWLRCWKFSPHYSRVQNVISTVQGTR